MRVEAVERAGAKAKPAKPAEIPSDEVPEKLPGSDTAGGDTAELAAFPGRFLPVAVRPVTDTDFMRCPSVHRPTAQPKRRARSKLSRSPVGLAVWRRLLRTPPAVIVFFCGARAPAPVGNCGSPKLPRSIRLPLFRSITAHSNAHCRRRCAFSRISGYCLYGRAKADLSEKWRWIRVGTASGVTGWASEAGARH